MTKLETIDATTGFNRAATSDILDALDEYVESLTPQDEPITEHIDPLLADAIQALYDRGTHRAHEWLSEHGYKVEVED